MSGHGSHSGRVGGTPQRDPNSHFGRPGQSPMAEAQHRRASHGNLAVGMPITPHDAEAMARVLREHGYYVRPASAAPRRVKRKTKRKVGLLVGFVRALTGGR